MVAQHGNERIAVNEITHYKEASNRMEEARFCFRMAGAGKWSKRCNK